MQELAFVSSPTNMNLFAANDLYDPNFVAKLTGRAYAFGAMLAIGDRVAYVPLLDTTEPDDPSIMFGTITKIEQTAVCYILSVSNGCETTLKACPDRLIKL